VWAGGGMHLEAGFDWSVMCRLLARLGRLRALPKVVRYPRYVLRDGTMITTIARDPLLTSSTYTEADAGQPTSVVGHQRAFLLAIRPSRSSAL